MTTLPMKAISLWEPWASLVAIEAKKIETRSWQTSHRGLIAIHAARHYSMKTAAFANSEPCLSIFRREKVEWGKFSFGCIIAVCELTDVFPLIERAATFRLSEQERAFGDYSPGRFAWLLKNTRRLRDPIPYRGRQGLFTLDVATSDELRRRIA